MKPVEDLIEAVDKLDHSTTKLRCLSDFIVNSEAINTDGLSMMIDDIVKEIETVSSLIH